MSAGTAGEHGGAGADKVRTWRIHVCWADPTSQGAKKSSVQTET